MEDESRIILRYNLYRSQDIPMTVIYTMLAKEFHRAEQTVRNWLSLYRRQNVKLKNRILVGCKEDAEAVCARYNILMETKLHTQGVVKQKLAIEFKTSYTTIVNILKKNPLLLEIPIDLRKRNSCPRDPNRAKTNEIEGEAYYNSKKNEAENAKQKRLDLLNKMQFGQEVNAVILQDKKIQLIKGSLVSKTQNHISLDIGKTYLLNIMVKDFDDLGVRL